MHKIKEKLMDELYQIEDRMKKNSGGTLSMQDIEKIQKLTDSVKNIDKIEVLESAEGYSEESYYMGEGRLYGTSYDDGMSYARGRGRNAKRDSRGRYSSDGMSYDDDMSYDDNSYARGGQGRGMNRGGRGMSNRGYSRDDATDQLMRKARKMMDEAESEQERRTIRQFMQLLEDED